MSDVDARRVRATFLPAVLVPLAGVVASIAAAGPAAASCAFVRDEDSDVSFVGVANDVRGSNQRGSTTGEAEFRVERWIRGGSGDLATVVVVFDAPGDGRFVGDSSGRPTVQPGERWEIRASRLDDGRLDPACHISIPREAGLPVPSRGPDWAIVGPLAALAAAVAVIGAVAIGRRRAEPIPDHAEP